MSMNLLQPEEPTWGACYGALLGAKQAGDLAAAQELLASGTPGRTLNALYPLDGFAFTANLAACSPVGSASLDCLETINWCYGGLGSKQISAVYFRLLGKSRAGIKDWSQGWKAALAALPLAKPSYGGRRSSLYLVWQVLQILPRWAELTWEERGEFYRICLSIDEALAADAGDLAPTFSAARWLAGTC